VLEIGPGTGQATLPLAERGCQIVAVELGADLGAVARRNLARFPQVQIVIAGFEDWPLPAEPFDVVLAATAFYWIDPAVRVSKAADALRPGGMLAIIATHHIAGSPVATRPSSPRYRAATRAGTQRPRPACGCRPLLRSPPQATSWTARAASAPQASAVTSGSSPTRPQVTWTCCSPTPATARWNPRHKPTCLTASPA
jgi:SAM-dependent methyltransferase